MTFADLALENVYCKTLSVYPSKAGSAFGNMVGGSKENTLIFCCCLSILTFCSSVTHTRKMSSSQRTISWLGVFVEMRDRGDDVTDLTRPVSHCQLCPQGENAHFCCRLSDAFVCASVHS